MKSSSWKERTRVSEFKNPVNVVVDRVLFLLEQLEELDRSGSVSGSPKMLLLFFRELGKSKLAALRSIRVALGKPNITDAERFHLTNQARFIGHLINVLYSCVRFIESARREDNPTGMLFPFEGLVSKYCEGVLAIIRPMWNYNYTYRELKFFLRKKGFFEDELKQASQAVQGKERFAILSYPQLERDNILLHSVLAHEMGHLINALRGIVSINEEGNITGRSEIIDKINYESKALYDQLDKLMQLESKLAQEKGYYEPLNLSSDQLSLFTNIDILRKILGELKVLPVLWLEEFTSDLIATRIMGPAFIFALDYFETALHTLDDFQVTHPTHRDRLRIVMNECKGDKGLNYLKFFEPGDRTGEDRHVCDVISSYFNQISSQVENPVAGNASDLESEIERLKRDIIHLMISDALIEVRRVVSTEIVPGTSAYYLEESIFDQVRKLKEMIPPAQKNLFKIGENDPAYYGLRAVVNAGWIFWMTYEMQEDIDYIGPHLGGEYEEDPSPFELVSKLVLKAIELGNFSQEYFDRKTQKAKDQ